MSRLIRMALSTTQTTVLFSVLPVLCRPGRASLAVHAVRNIAKTINPAPPTASKKERAAENARKEQSASEDKPVRKAPSSVMGFPRSVGQWRPAGLFFHGNAVTLREALRSNGSKETTSGLFKTATDAWKQLSLEEKEVYRQQARRLRELHAKAVDKLAAPTPAAASKSTSQPTTVSHRKTGSQPAEGPRNPNEMVHSTVSLLPVQPVQTLATIAQLRGKLTKAALKNLEAYMRLPPDTTATDYYNHLMARSKNDLLSVTELTEVFAPTTAPLPATGDALSPEQLEVLEDHVVKVNQHRRRVRVSFAKSHELLLILAALDKITIGT